MKISFLHLDCKRELCDDCKAIAEEYEELLQRRTRALQVCEAENKQLKTELENIKRRSAMYEEVAKAGIGKIIAAWMDKEITQILSVRQL